MTLLQPTSTYLITNGIHSKKRNLTVDDVVDVMTPATKRARKDSHENSPSLDTPPTHSFQHDSLSSSDKVPQTQHTLQLLGEKQPYTLNLSYSIPKTTVTSDEILIKIQTIGLNPIDWKAPDFGFGIPELPYIAGRDLVGTIVSEVPSSWSSRSRRPLRKGDVVFSASTDYRDLRKAAFQEFAVASASNVCRVPSNVRRESLAGLGVAFVAAVLTVGVCFGCDFSLLDAPIRGPNLLKMLRELPPKAISEDVREECLRGIDQSQQPKRGDWVAIWGGSSTTALIVAQLCKLLGLRVIKIVDVGKHGDNLSQGPADLLVDSHDPERAIDIVRKVTDNRLRFAVDTVGRPTSELLRRTLHSGRKNSEQSSHLVGLTGLPKDSATGIVQHTVPIKIHHEVNEVGEALMEWLEVMLEAGKVTPPEVEVMTGRLTVVNEGLDRMRRGEISGRRLAVRLV